MKHQILQLPNGDLVTVDSLEQAQHTLDAYYAAYKPRELSPPVRSKRIRAKHADKEAKPVPVRIYSEPDTKLKLIKAEMLGTLETADKAGELLMDAKRQRDRRNLAMLLGIG